MKHLHFPAGQGLLMVIPVRGCPSSCSPSLFLFLASAIHSSLVYVPILFSLFPFPSPIPNSQVTRIERNYFIIPCTLSFFINHQQILLEEIGFAVRVELVEVGIVVVLDDADPF